LWYTAEKLDGPWPDFFRREAVTASPHETLICDIARDVVEEAAPQELPIYQAASAAFFANPKRALRRSRSKDNVLGFGLDPLAALLTPAVLSILWVVFEFLAEIAKKAIEAGLEREITDVIKSMFKKFASSGPSVLTPKQVETVHQQVLLAAKKLKLPGGKAESLADAVLAQLVLPKR
jgi:hypothetical protein